MTELLSTIGGVPPRRPLPYSLKNVAAREIRHRIFAGELAPGSKIDQDALASELGISKLPIREALIALDSAGVIRSVDRKGAYVARLSRRDIEDHYEIFALVAGMAAERAAQNITGEGLAALTEIVARTKSDVDNAERANLNFEIHRIINHAADSRRLISVLRLLGHALPPGLNEFHRDRAEAFSDDHQVIVDALKSRSSSDAGEAMRRHIGAGAEQAIAALNARGFWLD